MLRRSCVKAVTLVSERCSKAGQIRHSTATALHFYQNRQLDLYAAKDAKRLTLRQLVSLFYDTEHTGVSNLALSRRFSLGGIWTRIV